MRAPLLRGLQVLEDLLYPPSDVALGMMLVSAAAVAVELAAGVLGEVIVLEDRIGQELRNPRPLTSEGRCLALRAYLQLSVAAIALELVYDLVVPLLGVRSVGVLPIAERDIPL